MHSQMLVHVILCANNRGRVAAKALQLCIEWGQDAVRRHMVESEHEDLDAKAVTMMPLLKTAFGEWKNFKSSPNWHKSRHVGMLRLALGRLEGLLNDEHLERRHKTGHAAYRKFSSKVRTPSQLTCLHSPPSKCAHLQSALYLLRPPSPPTCPSLLATRVRRAYPSLTTRVRCADPRLAT
jgi:hypothetical protein